MLDYQPSLQAEGKALPPTLKSAGREGGHSNQLEWQCLFQWHVLLERNFRVDGGLVITDNHHQLPTLIRSFQQFNSQQIPPVTSQYSDGELERSTGHSFQQSLKHFFLHSVVHDWDRLAVSTIFSMKSVLLHDSTWQHFDKSV